MHTITRVILALAVLSVLLTTTVSVATARPSDNANPVTNTALTNQYYMKNMLDSVGTPANQFATYANFGNGLATSSTAHDVNGPP